MLEKVTSLSTKLRAEKKRLQESLRQAGAARAGGRGEQAGADGSTRARAGGSDRPEQAEREALKGQMTR